MEKKEAGRLIIDGLEKGYLTISWATGKKKSYHKLIEEGKKLGFLIEICAGCGRPTSGRDCGCPAGTNLKWK